MNPHNMLDASTVIDSRDAGNVIYKVISDHSGNLEETLKQFGLFPDKSSLIECSKNTSFEIIKALLWKDMAYECECMPEAQAKYLAKQIIEQHSNSQSRYFSNGNWALAHSWNPLTPSTFDSGILIINTSGQHFCIWFEDED